MERENLIEKYNAICHFRELTKQECVDKKELVICQHIVEIIDKECERIERMLEPK